MNISVPIKIHSDVKTRGLNELEFIINGYKWNPDIQDFDFTVTWADSGNTLNSTDYDRYVVPNRAYFLDTIRHYSIRSDISAYPTINITGNIDTLILLKTSVISDWHTILKQDKNDLLSVLIQLKHYCDESA